MFMMIAVLKIINSGNAIAFLTLTQNRDRQIINNRALLEAILIFLKVSILLVD